MADSLELEMRFFEDGVASIFIDEKAVNPQRFRLSDRDDGAVLQPMVALDRVTLKSMITYRDDSLIVTYPADEDGRVHEYIVQYSPFRVIY